MKDMNENYSDADNGDTKEDTAKAKKGLGAYGHIHYVPTPKP